MSNSSANAEEGICPSAFWFSSWSNLVAGPGKQTLMKTSCPATVRVIFLVEVDLRPFPFSTNILNTVRDAYHTFLVHKGLALLMGY